MENRVVRKRVKRVLPLLCITVALNAPITATAPVSVVFAETRDIQFHWAGTAVNTLMEHGILQNVSEDRFKPDRNITRGETAGFFAAYLRHAIPKRVKGMGMDISFSDVDADSGVALDISMLAQLGIISGNPDGTFRPEAPLSREAFASMVDSMNNVIITEETSTTAAVSVSSSLKISDIMFADTENSYARTAISNLASDGILHGYPDGTFRPENLLTRAETAAVLFSMSKLDPLIPEISLPFANKIEVPYISQIEPYRAWKGCEATSLLMGMQAKGYALDVTLKDFLDGMPKHPSNPEKGFAGSPYMVDKEKKIRTTIYPQKLAEYASAYGKVKDFSGSSVEELQAEILAGHPAVVYVTMRWKNPVYRTYEIEGEYQYLLSNNHAVLICGYDSKTSQYYIADPYNYEDPKEEYKYWIDAGILDPIYNVRKQALVIE